MRWATIGGDAAVRGRHRLRGMPSSGAERIRELDSSEHRQLSRRAAPAAADGQAGPLISCVGVTNLQEAGRYWALVCLSNGLGIHPAERLGCSPPNNLQANRLARPDWKTLRAEMLGVTRCCKQTSRRRPTGGPHS